MMTLEEIQTIESYCSENGIILKKRLHKFNFLMNDMFNADTIRTKHTTTKSNTKGTSVCAPIAAKALSSVVHQGNNHHLYVYSQVDKNHFYSTPYQHIGNNVKVIYDVETVEVWIGLDRKLHTTERTRTDTQSKPAYQKSICVQTFIRS